PSPPHPPPRPPDRPPRRAGSDPERYPWEGEEGQVRLLTYQDLWQEVSRAANGLRTIGLGKGDIIGLYTPVAQLNPEAVEEIRRAA
ncbi:MAG TPA: hypothetical protein EYH30_03975, partial [Anaerolineales bacterium]|nr:hypothetical protein [Anaerolineales bacterium]